MDIRDPQYASSLLVSHASFRHCCMCVSMSCASMIWWFLSLHTLVYTSPVANLALHLSQASHKHRHDVTSGVAAKVGRAHVGAPTSFDVNGCDWLTNLLTTVGPWVWVVFWGRVGSLSVGQVGDQEFWQYAWHSTCEHARATIW